ncbi:hypothetical protein [Actinocrispum sp. NPDC049592]|uniref:hypothetical protein n=1 Tax=Actinocrispum sp. NPDC049592 TaxID=3154835 RepID=UPI00342DBDB4
MDHFEDGARLLAPLRDVDPDLRSGVDVTRAVKTGRRRRRSRLVVAAVGVVAVLGLSALVAPGLVSGLRENPPATGLADPTLFDMRSFPLQVGTAGGYKPLMYSVMRVKASVSLVRTDGRPGTGEVSMYPRTRFQPDPAAAGFPAAQPPIEGRRVFWMPGEATPTLVMEYGTDRWVQVTIEDDQPDLRNRVYHVAESVAFTSADVQLPFTISPTEAGLPSNLLEIQNTVPLSPPETSVVKLSFEPLGRTPQVTITATPQAPSITTNEVINGHAAAVSPGEIILRDVEGYSFKLHVDTPLEDFGADRLKALAATIDLVPGGWTNAPVR